MLKYMIDINIAIYTLKNRPARVRAAFKKHSGEICISSVSMGELIYGAEKSARVEQNLSIIEGLGARLKIESFDMKAAMHFGQLRAGLDQSKASMSLVPFYTNEMATRCFKNRSAPKTVIVLRNPCFHPCFCVVPKAVQHQT